MVKKTEVKSAAKPVKNKRLTAKQPVSAKQEMELAGTRLSSPDGGDHSSYILYSSNQVHKQASCSMCADHK